MRIAAGIVVVAALVTGARAAAFAQSVAFGSGALVARVRDAANRPLPGALVEAVGPVTRSATSGASGVVALVGLLPGWYDVAVSLNGYQTFEQRLSVGGDTASPQVIAPTLQLTSFANDVSAATRVLPGLGGTIDPYAAHVVVASDQTDLVAAGAGAGIAVDGTQPYESRVELDGMPLAGGADSAAVMRFRDAFGLAGIDVSSGPWFASSDVRDAIGGVIGFRTPAVDAVQTLGLDQGYDSAFGSFEHARAVKDFGDVSLAFDAVTGGGVDRSDSFKARYAFSPTSSIDVASYDLAGAGDVGNASVAASAPAFSAGVRLGLGGGTLQARTYQTSLHETSTFSTAEAPDEDARTAGVQLGYDLPLGADRVSFAFDRRTDAVAYENDAPFSQTFTSFATRAEFALASAVRLGLADIYSGGTLVQARNDPQAELSYRAGSRFTLRAAAGSAYATPPDALLALHLGPSAQLLPETAFKLRLTAEERLDASDVVRVTAFDGRQFDTFGTYANAAERGAGLEFERTRSHGFGLLAYVRFDRSYAYGNVQPWYRDGIPTGYDGGSQSADVPEAKARVALTYRTSATCESHIATTFLGADDAFATHDVALGDAALCLPVFGFVNVRVGESNVFGAVVRDPVLAPLLVPREFTFSLGLH